ncbi:HK97 family phage prohead protease [Bacillus thuringiensis]|nr:HK97 family phage prohead protease [Bacillus thuringiensis]
MLGRTKNNTLRLSEDAVGLRFELDLPDTTLGNDTYKSIKRGDVDGVSFGFSMISEEIQEPDDDLMLRTVTKAKLLEVSAVAFPAYPDSEVSARDMILINILQKKKALGKAQKTIFTNIIIKGGL